MRLEQAYSLELGKDITADEADKFFLRSFNFKASF
jgi:hypothetical protein